MKYIIKFFLILFLLLFFWSCSNISREEKQKQDCLSKNKAYAYEKALNYRTGKYEVKIVCK